jgi:hypothetical protein
MLILLHMRLAIAEGKVLDEVTHGSSTLDQEQSMAVD